MIIRLLNARLLPVVFVMMLTVTSNAQLLTWSPSFIQESSSGVVITVDGSKGNQGLYNYASPYDVYVHIGVITNLSTSASNWKYVPFTWGTTNASAQATYLFNNKWSYTIPGSLRSFFNITNPSETIQKIAILFRSGNGSKKQTNTDGSDMYIPVYDNGFYARLDKPAREPKYTPTVETITAAAGDLIPIEGNASSTSRLRVIFNGTPSDSLDNTTTISSSIHAVSGDNQIVLEASDGTNTSRDTVNFFINTPVVTASQPPNTVDGINYDPADPTRVTLVLYAPNKTRAAVVGDFNNWTQTSSYQMYRTPDGLRYWITLTGLTSGQEYAFQYIIDGNIWVADIYAEKILDPWNDQYIPAANYPGLKAYPSGQSNIVSVFQTNKPSYSWNVTNFSRPDKRNLLIYELLVRDFVSAQNWQTLKDTLSYLKRLGINAIEVMPFNEFEGNNSWGYNPDFFFAPDKMYGTENNLKQFIDVCHQNGIAVIMDIAMNHAFGLSPTVRMYWDAANNRPAANSAWHNPVATHPYSVGYDFNHEAPATKDLVARVIRHWLTNYKIDGFRWDLSKGFTQTNSGNDVGVWNNYDASRVAIWQRIYDSMQSVSPNSYCILEHLGGNSEEMALANYGMLLWGKATEEFNQATMGYNAGSDFNWGIYTSRGWSVPNLVTYQESHDEERLMYKNLAYGNSSGSYNIRTLTTALKRNEMAAAFWSMIPGPKMLWQFGELGYDYTINLCDDGFSTNAGCRTAMKPVVWGYQSNSDRVALYNVYRKLFTLRKYAPYLSAFTSNNIEWSLNGTFKYLKVSSGALNIVVVGNFDVNAQTGYVQFQSAGTWYDYLNGGTITSTGAVQGMSMQPGEYHVYLDRNASFLLPLTLVSFDGKRGNDAIELNWTTNTEVNVSHFELQRSFDGGDFTTFTTVNARNNIATNYYTSKDADSRAVRSSSRVYYRLKMVDKDGNFSYSRIVEIKPLKEASAVVYPNPVKGNEIFLKLATSNGKKLSISLTDASGKTCQHWNYTTTTTNDLKLDITGIANGIYFLKLFTEDGSEVYPVLINK